MTNRTEDSRDSKYPLVMRVTDNDFQCEVLEKLAKDWSPETLRVFASALGYLVQTWAQRRTSATRTALVFTMEPVWTAFFGYTLAGDRLGALGWGGCAAIMVGIVLAEPAAAGVLAGKLDTLRLRFSQ